MPHFFVNLIETLLYSRLGSLSLRRSIAELPLMPFDIFIILISYIGSCRVAVSLLNCLVTICGVAALLCAELPRYHFHITISALLFAELPCYFTPSCRIIR